MSNFLHMVSKNKYKVQGLNLENFLFKLTSSGISVSKLKRKKDCLFFSSYSINDKTIKDFAQELGLSIKVVGEIGLIKLIKKLPYQIGGLLGIAVAIYFSLFCTSYITNVEYVVPQNHSCTNYSNCIYNKENFQLIKQYISQYISVGNIYKSNSIELQNNVIANFELVENCTITKTGCSVVIEFTEAVGKQTSLPTQIVATQNCVISSITTFSGVAKVKAGDVVKMGQVLVDSDGDILPRANIIAKVWYLGMAIHNCNQLVYEPTGKTYTATDISVFNLKVLSGKKSDFNFFTKQVSTNYITNLFLPIKKITTVYNELQLAEKYVPFEDVKDQILQKSKQDALNKTKGSPIECTYSIVTECDVVRVDCFLLVEEQMGTV